MRRAGALTAALAVALAAPVTAQQLQMQLATADTRVVLEAGAAAPRLLRLAVPHGRVWTNRAAETLPSAVEFEGAARTLSWRLDRGASHGAARGVEFVYRCDSPRLRLTWSWQARAAFGPLEHHIVIENLGEEEVWLPLPPSIRFDWRVPPADALERFWVEKGADTPSAAGTHLDAMHDGDTWQGTSSSYARPRQGEPREMIPYVLITHGAAGEGWYLGIEYSARTRMRLRRGHESLQGEAGLNPEPGPYRTRLAPRASFATAPVLLGAARGGADGAGNVLRRWVRQVLNNPRTLSDVSYPFLVSNSWGSGMAVDSALARRMIDDAAALGMEMFHLDAGWFREVGDWQPDPRKFPDGIAGVADYAHRRGLKFGLWLDWAQAATSTEPGALNVADPTVRDWLIADPPPAWRHTEPFKGVTLDLGVPAAQAWAQRELERIVADYHLDMLEHDGYLVAQGSTRTDHPAAPPQGATRVYEDSGFVWADASNATDVSDHATRAYYEIYRRLRASHPQLLLEICNDGGRMVDFGSAAHGDYFSITDTYDPLSNRRAFYDASYVLPPAMLESYVAESPAPRIENFRYVLRSGMLGWFSLMQDASRWSAEQRAAAQREFDLYKRTLRPLIRAADLYHVSARPDGRNWDGIEYYSKVHGRGVLYAFRGSGPDALHRFQLRGLEPSQDYAVTFNDRVASVQVRRGAQLMSPGLALTLTTPLSSELVFFERLPAHGVPATAAPAAR
ncbi:MAG TPA: alpha-galactosidase [Candidatus Dormibacteraeota bacterium]|nr:alpha-galactosidase [Candidatus Dormibacteraeota bacterium]